tara:strand:- start:2367 stop:2789 length:423 start_codon:yes stop_codon:yes gene_type:complete
MFLSSCGYQPLLKDKNQKFNIDQVNLIGDRKLGQRLSNRFQKIDNVKNNLIVEIKSSKKKEISSRSSAGVAAEYSMSLNFDLKVTDYSGSIILENNFSESGSYKASELYINTLNRERKIVDNMIKTIAERISTQLSLIYQ